MSKRARLSSLKKELETPATPQRNEELLDYDPNPDKGERGEFLRVTVTLPEQMLGALQSLGRRRKRNKQKNTTISALVREFVAEGLKKED
jgi:hypothetical protein